MCNQHVHQQDQDGYCVCHDQNHDEKTSKSMNKYGYEFARMNFEHAKYLKQKIGMSKN